MKSYFPLSSCRGVFVFTLSMILFELGIAQKVGIGMTDPTHKLTIQSLSDSTLLRLIGPDAYGHGARLNFGDANYTYIEEDVDDHLTLYGHQRTAIMGGNVGIGTTTPDAKFTVAGTLKVQDGTEGAGKIMTSDNNGFASWLEPESPKAALFVATDQSIGNNNFVGLGSSSATFARNSLVIPFNCEITSISISIRETLPNSDITATVWRKDGMNVPVPTTLSATIADGTVQISSTGTGSVFVLQGDLIAIQINWATGGALPDGVTASVAYR